MTGERPRKVCLVGPSTHFLSGITYYTYSLARALSEEYAVSAVLLRRLLPRRLYPGHARVGTQITGFDLPPRVRVFDGVDWYWLPSLLRAVRFLRRERPDVVVMQWWTGTVLHTLLALALVSRALGAKVVIEFHESLDTGEDRIRGVGRYVGLLGPRLFRLADRYVVHSDYDLDLITGRFGLDRSAFDVIPHATYGHYRETGSETGGETGSTREAAREAPAGVCNLLYFGIIRPFKGVEDLVRAFEAIPEDEIDRYWLTVVGETWEGHDLPTRLMQESPRSDRMTLVNRYVTDEEVDDLFRGADVVVLPYHRSSQSGPLHVAMDYGLPVVVTAVGGLVEAVASYEGAVQVSPRDPASLLEGVRTAYDLAGTTFPPPHDWSASVTLYRPVLD